MKKSLAFVDHLHAVSYLKTVSYQKITFWESLVWGSRLPWYHLVSEFISSLNIGRCEFDQEIIFVYEIWRFMYVSFEALYKIPFWTSCNHLTIFFQDVMSVFSHCVCRGMWSGVFTYGILTKILCALPVFCGILCMYCYTILLGLIVRIILDTSDSWWGHCSVRHVNNLILFFWVLSLWQWRWLIPIFCFVWMF